ncbi:TPA: hypothetical protein MJF74_001812 [Clostridioides difficile]|nr:hypothetical protein [Clostridioides difficile]
MKNKDKKPTTNVVETKEDDFTLDWWEIPPDIRPHLPSIEEPENSDMSGDVVPVPDELNPFSTKYKYKGKEEEVPPNEWFSKN